MLKSVVKSVSKKYDFDKMESGQINIYEVSTFGGEDAWFIADNIVGVADGVSGWNTKGVSAAFSNSLMIECLRLSNLYDSVIEILDKAYTSTKNNVVGGSSTVCITKLNPLSVKFDTFYLNVANHGDSGLIIIRDNKIIHKTSRDYISDEMPYQLGKWELNDDKLHPSVHESQVNKLYNETGRRIIDTKLYNFEVKYNDILITATDGFFDNMEDFEIIDSLSNLISTQNLEQTSLLLMKRAIKNTNQAFKKNYRCIDDITIILSLVTKNNITNELNILKSNKKQKLISI